MDQGDGAKIDVLAPEALSLVPAPEMHLPAVEPLPEKGLQGRTEPADISGIQGIPGIVDYRTPAACSLGVNPGEPAGLFPVQFVYSRIHGYGKL